MAKHKAKGSNSNFKKTILILLLIICICSIILFIKIKASESIDNNKQKEISQIIDTIDIPKEDITPVQNERMLKVAELKKTNNDIIGWIEIAGTNINYPVLQGQDNEYYLNHKILI